VHLRNKCLSSAFLVLAFATSVVTPLAAQADTARGGGPTKPLFTWNDAALAGAYTLGTFAIRPLDKSFAIRLQNKSAQENKFYGNAATWVRNIATPGSVIIGVSMYTYGRLAHNDKAADLGLHGTEALFVGAAVGAVLKGMAGRGRPYADSTPNPDNWSFGRGFKGDDKYRSFPSGHTIAAFAAASAVTAETHRWWPNSAWIVAPAMYGGAALTGLSRMYNNRHWASDVVMGAAIGTFAGLKVVRYHHTTAPDNRLDRWLLNVSLTPAPDGGAMVSLSVLPPLR
jgi:membrane-associated phospholipid phosphatase